MFRKLLFSHRSISVFFENEGVEAHPLQEEPKKPFHNEAQLLTPLEEVHQKQNVLNAKRIDFESSRNKLVSLTDQLEKIKADRVRIILDRKGFFKDLPEDQRQAIAKTIVKDYISSTQFTERQATIRKSLEQNNAPEIEKSLAIIDAYDFEEFVKSEIKKLRVLANTDKYYNLLPDEEKTVENKNKLKSFFESDSANYRLIRDRIIEENKMQGKVMSDEDVRKQVRAEIQKNFGYYCDKNNIRPQLPEEGVKEIVVEEDDVSKVVIYEESIFTTAAQKNIAKVDKETKEAEYSKEYHQYKALEETTQSEGSAFGSPKALIDLPVGSSTTFVSNDGSSHMLYSARKEPDGQFTLTFGNIVLKDLPKKEVDMIVNLNSIPVISSIFSLQSGLYKTLFREYSFLCKFGGADPLQNPPIGFTEFIYRRLSDAYEKANPDENERFLIGSNLSHLSYLERGKYISDVLRTSEGTRSSMIRKLEKQQILINGRINLSKFPV